MWPKYYIRWRSKVSGPYDAVSLKSMLIDGKITKHHQVSEDREMWTALVAPAVEPVVRSGYREVEAGLSSPSQG